MVEQHSYKVQVDGSIPSGSIRGKASLHHAFGLSSGRTLSLAASRMDGAGERRRTCVDRPLC
jgi:hypothetical protein